MAKWQWLPSPRRVDERILSDSLLSHQPDRQRLEAAAGVFFIQVFDCVPVSTERDTKLSRQVERTAMTGGPPWLPISGYAGCVIQSALG